MLYIQDIILPTPSVFDQIFLSTISSFKKFAIVSMLQEVKFLFDMYAVEMRLEAMKNGTN